MSDITVTAAQVARVFDDNSGKNEIYDGIAGETITAGLALYIKGSDGKLYKADANAGSDAEEFRGVALNGGGAGQAISFIKRGCVYGFDLSGMNAEALAYVSDTAGALADSAGSVSVIAGRVFRLSDKDQTRVLFVEADWHNNHS
ncbi:MAG: hypothetical protein JXA14_26360 [Anaerolineae bacterium]|nr:hypothetical protein [Anaerolineae bacterium]